MEGTKYILTSRINQDPLENCFSMIRTRGGYDLQPTIRNFRMALQHNMHIRLYIPVEHGNCEMDSDGLLCIDQQLNSDISKEDEIEEDGIKREEYNYSFEETSELESELTNAVQIEMNKSLESCTVAYIAGYLLKMAMSRQGLTEDEVRRLLLLLDGDISDVDIESDGEDDELFTASNLTNNKNSPSTSVPVNGVDVEVENVDSEYSSEDDLPLANLKQKDLESISADCYPMFSDPPHPEMTPLNYFKQLFDDNLIDHVVTQTNLYSVEKTGISVNTNKEEIEQFIGCQILSGVVKMPSYRMYWAESSRYSPIADIMSRNRFDKLRNFLHLNDNSQLNTRNDPEYDKLFKIRPIIEAIRANLRKIEPEEHNSIDEIIIPFKGRSSLKQFVKNKPHKWGIKMFARASSNGIIHDFEIYVGKGTVKETSELGIRVYPIETVQRWSVGDKRFIDVQRPGVIKHYNSFMGGVDLHDMLVALYRINFVVKRFYLRIFWNLVDMCIVNAWLLYRRHMSQSGQKNWKSLLVFRSEIAHALLRAGKGAIICKRGRPSSTTSSPPPFRKYTKVPAPIDDMRYDGFQHFPIHIEPKKRCRLCIKAYSRVMREKCQTPLCLTKDKNCFKLFHNK
ncbi:hypothetical protein FQR65_LT14556 [Abscondita terminalis]|nr:hypothetical protein FQR65_LT14556 [Abscondita terminalis]